jgi:CRP/FNR family cyclic AMP-dependent transcriptional regulator
MDPRDLLRDIYLFRDAAPQDLAAVAAIAERKVYMVGEYIYQSGDTPDALFIIESGTIDITLKDKDVPLASVGAGQALGELAFFERAERLASAFTRERTHVIRLPFAKLDEVFTKHPNLAMIFYRHACVFFSRQLRAVAPDLNRRYF